MRVTQKLQGNKKALENLWSVSWGKRKQETVPFQSWILSIMKFVKQEGEESTC